MRFCGIDPVLHTFPHAFVAQKAVEGFREPQNPGTSWNEGLERGNELERGTGTRIKLERAGTRIWNEAPAGTRIAGTSLSIILDNCNEPGIAGMSLGLG